MVKDYKVVQMQTPDVKDFEKEINEIIKEGYRPFGDMIMTLMPMQSKLNPEPMIVPVYTQAMIKDESE